MGQTEVRSHEEIAANHIQVIRVRHNIPLIMQYHYANVGFYSHYALLHGFVNYQAKLQPQLHLKWKMMWQIFPTI